MLSLLACSKKDRSYWLQLKKGSIIRAQESITTGSIVFGNRRGKKAAAHIANAWAGLMPLLRSDSPGKSSHSWHLLPGHRDLHRDNVRSQIPPHVELTLLSQLRNPSSSPPHLIYSHMGNILTVYISLGIHFSQCWQPSETFTEHEPRRKVRQPLLGVMLRQEMFWFRKVQSRVNLTQGRKACICQGTALATLWKLVFSLYFCALLFRKS